MYFSQLNNKVLNIACCFDKLIDDTFYMGPHYHPRIEIMYCYDGEFSIEFFHDLEANTPPVVLNFQPRSFVIIHPNVTHNLIIPKGKWVRMLNVEFTLSPPSEKFTHKVFYLHGENLLRFHPGLKSFTENKSGYVAITDNVSFGKHLKNYIDLAGNSLQSNERQLEMQVLLYSLILEFGKCYENDNKIKTGIKYIKLAIDYIEKNYTQKLSVEQIAEASGINKFYLQKLFQQHLKKSVLSVLNTYRIEQCKQLLTSSNTSLKNLHSLVGFSNRQTLLYEFKKATNVSPTEYKNKIENKTTDVKPKKEDLNSTVEVKPGRPKKNNES